jgi:hypothetical protein
VASGLTLGLPSALHSGGALVGLVVHSRQVLVYRTGYHLTGLPTSLTGSDTFQSVKWSSRPPARPLNGILRENHFCLDTWPKTGLFSSLWSGELQGGCGAWAASKMTEETQNLCDLKTRFVLLHARKESTKVVTRVLANHPISSLNLFFHLTMYSAHWILECREFLSLFGTTIQTFLQFSAKSFCLEL